MDRVVDVRCRVRCRDDFDNVRVVAMAGIKDPCRAIPNEDSGCCSREEVAAFADRHDVLVPNEKATTPSRSHDTPRSNKDEKIFISLAIGVERYRLALV
jgi:hypothetical protein